MLAIIGPDVRYLSATSNAPGGFMALLLNEIEWGEPLLPAVPESAWEADTKRWGLRPCNFDARPVSEIMGFRGIHAQRRLCVWVQARGRIDQEDRARAVELAALVLAAAANLHLWHGIHAPIARHQR